MKIGMVLPETGQQATRENIIQAAKQAEEERFVYYGYGRDFYVL